VKAITVAAEAESDGMPPGALQPIEREGRIAMLAVACPGCGSISAIDIRPHGVPGRAAWDLLGWPGSPSLQPSLHHARDLGGCGWHGWLEQGEWRAV
jgi:hypothetical protein